MFEISCIYNKEKTHADEKTLTRSITTNIMSV